MNPFILSIVFGVITAILYRLGGLGDDFWLKYRVGQRWMFQSWVRDWLIGPACVVSAFLLGVHSWWLLLVIPLTGAALSTYWDFLFGSDNFWVHGLFVGIAAAPIAYASGHWFGFLLRCVLLAVWMGGISAISKNDWVEELGRGLIIGSTLFMLC